MSDMSAEAAARVSRVRERLHQIAATTMDRDAAAFLRGPVDDELQLLEHMLTEEAAQS